MRKLLIILPALCLFIYLGGYWILALVQQHALKREMMQALRHNPRHKDIEHFELNMVNGEPSDPSFRWEEENEFSYKGRMYDVIETKRSGTKLYISCVNDKKEDTLIQELAAIQNNRHNKPINESSSMSFLFGLFFAPGDVNLKMTFADGGCAYYPRYNISFSSVAADIQTPPPRS